MRLQSFLLMLRSLAWPRLCAQFGPPAAARRRRGKPARRSISPDTGSRSSPKTGAGAW